MSTINTGEGSERERKGSGRGEQLQALEKNKWALGTATAVCAWQFHNKHRQKTQSSRFNTMVFNINLMIHSSTKDR